MHNLTNLLIRENSENDIKIIFGAKKKKNWDLIFLWAGSKRVTG